MTDPVASEAAPVVDAGVAEPVVEPPPAEPALAPEDLAALTGDGEIVVATDGTETVSIGGFDVPVSVLSDLPDEVLGKIRRKIKSAGEEREVSMLDALKAVPQAEGWQKRQWQAADKEKKLREAASGMSGDVIRAVMQLEGVDRNAAVDIVAKQMVAILERDQMSPAERQAAEYQEELVRRAAKADEYEATERGAAETRAVAEQRDVFRAGMSTALSASGLVESDRTIGRMAGILDRAMRDGVIPVSGPIASDYTWAAEQVAKEWSSERDAYYEGAEGDQLIERVGEKRARAIARAYAKRVQRNRQAPRRADAKPGDAAPPSQEGPPQTWAQWKLDADQRMGIK